MHDELFKLDLNFLVGAHINDADILKKYDDEIEKLVSVLWKNCGTSEDLIQPFFVTYLQNSILRPLYIYHHCINLLLGKRINLIDSLSVIDIIFNHYKLPINPSRVNHDKQFFLGRSYAFNNRSYFVEIRNILKRALDLDIKKTVIYADAGKLSIDLKKINGIDFNLVPFQRNRAENNKINKLVIDLINASINNIDMLDLSLPKEIVKETLNKYVYLNLEKCFLRIEDFRCYIKKYNIKLAMISAPTHEDHLALLAAAKLEGIPSLLVGHGYAGGIKNAYLKKYISHQATINSSEYLYCDAKQFKYEMRWFDEKKI